MSAEWEKAEQLQVRFTNNNFTPYSMVHGQRAKHYFSHWGKFGQSFSNRSLIPACCSSYDLIHLTTDLAGVGHHSDGRVQGVPSRRAAQDPRHQVARGRPARRIHGPSYEGGTKAVYKRYIICRRISELENCSGKSNHL